ncbi:hypothetical protein ABD87_22845 [Lysinibacillus sphaericus]|uniref:hypothetical protein n=1 Tax=Lysinibacillus sphaericus TaxID=1421 RepID=UPI0018CE64B1|nr:hypothetical protein [Lysinibacillus sphaericus]MBG9732266.1 hypothetical protein [Lysinibacillus sphaericus]
MQISYTGQYLTQRKPIKTNHRILVFHRFDYGDNYDNRPYDEILKQIPNAYCDGWTIFLPSDFDSQVINNLIEYFQDDRYLFPNNIQSIGYVNDELKKLTKIYEYKHSLNYDKED